MRGLRNTSTKVLSPAKTMGTSIKLRQQPVDVVADYREKKTYNWSPL